MGRHPTAKADKVIRGTYRPDRDKSSTAIVDDEIPLPPDGLGSIGLNFWNEAFCQPWVTKSDQTIVHLIARKLEERELVAEQCQDSPSDYWRQQRTLKEIDRDVMAGLDQLLLTPLARKKIGLEISNDQAPPTKRSLLTSLAKGEISESEYEAQLGLVEERNELAPREGTDQTLLDDAVFASNSRILSIMNPDGLRKNT